VIQKMRERADVRFIVTVDLLALFRAFDGTERGRVVP
jgi:hypothetical protein